MTTRTAHVIWAREDRDAENLDEWIEYASLDPAKAQTRLAAFLARQATHKALRDELEAHLAPVRAKAAALDIRDSHARITLGNEINAAAETWLAARGIDDPDECREILHGRLERIEYRLFTLEIEE